MTKAELMWMFGTEGQADYVIDIILGQVNKDFVKSAIESKLSETEKRMKELEEEGVIYTNYGTKNVRWDVSKTGDERDKQFKAHSLLSLSLRLTTLLAVMQYHG